jgi:hypothetical protein
MQMQENITLEACAALGEQHGRAAALRGVVAIYMPDQPLALGKPVPVQVAMIVAAGPMVGPRAVLLSEGKVEERRRAWHAEFRAGIALEKAALTVNGADHLALTAYEAEAIDAAADVFDAFTAGLDGMSDLVRKPLNRADRRRLEREDRIAAKRFQAAGDAR